MLGHEFPLGLQREKNGKGWLGNGILILPHFRMNFLNCRVRRKNNEYRIISGYTLCHYFYLHDSDNVYIVYFVYFVYFVYWDVNLMVYIMLENYLYYLFLKRVCFHDVDLNK